MRRAPRTWPSWAGYAAAAWSFGYGLLGVLWSLGMPGFPFGEGDIPDAREESILGGATAQGTAPWIAVVGVLGGLVALVLARSRIGGPLRAAAAVWGWVAAVALVVFVPDQRVLTTLAYTPLGLVGIPLGWPPISYSEFLDIAYPWPTVNLMICAVGGLLWAAATVAFQRRTAGACTGCGRRADHPAHWTTPSAAARWGRWAAYTAALIPFTYAVIRWAWALGIPLTITDEFLAELHDTGLVWAGAYLATFAALGGILTLGLVQRWGTIWPRWVIGLAGRRVPPAFPITLATVVATALASAGAVIVRLTDWTKPEELLKNPGILWPVWSAAIAAATLAYYLRTRGACQLCGLGEEEGR
ncbi:MAG: hypothetical protein GEV03_28650 [Streptosporangiales bacterium]|nr:hypothetical protein [Streptosporangiales bacterium]